MKISVIVPIYNTKSNILSRCLDSILNQTYKDLEIILIDDGSTNEETISLLDDYSKKDGRIILVKQNNSGTSSSRNNGISISTGEYITFVDHDDYLNPAMYEKMVDAVLKNNADMAICNFVYVDEDGNLTKQNKTNVFEDKVITNIDTLKHLHMNDRGYYHMIWNKLTKREIILKELFPTGKLYEDAVVSTSWIYYSNKIVTISEPLYNYIQYNDSQFHTISNKRKLEKYELYFYRDDFYKDRNIVELIKLNDEDLLSIYLISKYKLNLNNDEEYNLRLKYEKEFRKRFFKRKQSLKNIIKLYFPYIYIYKNKKTWLKKKES